ncbi:MAG: AmmeMemoRadiSam system protein A [Actinomyces sp.]|nr:AmmeMemoRadiSam system protein A [Actinomyces sp.]MDU1521293.1 AmmeMemoRadiSam system protein A [Actinomyces sp.]MDU2984739.1 AmmeMemoRadiSam system protein A [Actinomyces sp.]MDU7730577.1 AmmeMemoRadiSam system protein A [Actinomyces sp.]
MPTPLPDNAGRILVPLARGAIRLRLQGTRTDQIVMNSLPAPHDRPEWLQEPGTSFVTLTINSHLRGCIGSLSPRGSLYDDVIHNALAAAFHDPRFDPLDATEYPSISVEVSVLSAPVALPALSEKAVLESLRPGIDGVVLIAGPTRRATFLPQVWDDLADPADFFAHLKRKAGLPTTWWSPDARVETYTVRAFTDQDADGDDDAPASASDMTNR